MRNSRRHNLRRDRARGMTLVELLIVILVVAILASLATSSYRNFLMRTNRTDGRQLLLRIQVAEEKFFLQNGTYTADLVTPPPVGLGTGNTSQAGYYTFAVAPGPTGIGSSYVATATAAGSQTQDAAICQVMSINDQGVHTPADSTGCWK